MQFTKDTSRRYQIIIFTILHFLLFVINLILGVVYKIFFWSHSVYSLVASLIKPNLVIVEAVFLESQIICRLWMERFF